MTLNINNSTEIAGEPNHRFTLAHLTEDELKALAVALDEQFSLGPGQPGATPRDIPLVSTDSRDAVRTGLRRALREIDEHNSESKYHTGRDLENMLRRIADIDPLDRYENERHNTSHY